MGEAIASVIDLRSDTVTRPTGEMRRAMASAEVGDDVYSEDPTVNVLEAETAALVGHEAALFVPSGTMGNQVALLCHTVRGDEVFAHREAHIHYYEGGAPALLGGVTVQALDGWRGRFGVAELAAALRPADVHFSRARLVCIENTHNRGGGSVWPVAEVRTLADFAHGAGLLLHVDGARIWNAAIALGVPVAQLCRPADTVMCCLSKGLCAPVGSLLCGPAETIARARRYRKVLGGGMRQAGILAAAGLVALRTMVDRLAADHANARYLAEGLCDVRGLAVHPEAVETNIVLIHSAQRQAPEIIAALARHGVRVGAMGLHTLRLVTHHDVSREACTRAIEALRRVMAG